MRRIMLMALLAAALTSGAAPAPPKPHHRSARTESQGRMIPACGALKDLLTYFQCLADGTPSVEKNPACPVLYGLTQAFCTGSAS